MRRPGCDHGHDEESQNGRDIKIDILEVYIQTLEWFGSFRISFGVPGVTRTLSGKLLGLMGLMVEERGQATEWRTPP